MLKGLGYFLIILAAFWFLYVAAGSLLEVRKETTPLDEALIRIALAGLLPVLVASAAGSGLVILDRRQTGESKDFEYEKTVLHILHKEGQTHFDAILGQIPINRQELAELLVRMGEKRLFTGYINWKERQIVSSELVEVTHGECPICGSLTGSPDPHRANCTRCDAIIFIPDQPAVRKDQSPQEG